MSLIHSRRWQRFVGFEFHRFEVSLAHRSAFDALESESFNLMLTRINSNDETFSCLLDISRISQRPQTVAHSVNRNSESSGFMVFPFAELCVNIMPLTFIYFGFSLLPGTKPAGQGRVADLKGGFHETQTSIRNLSCSLLFAETSQRTSTMTTAATAAATTTRGER